MDNTKIEHTLMELLTENKAVEQSLLKNEAIVIFSNGNIRVIDGLQYGKAEIPFHAGKIKQVNVTQNIRMNE